MTSVRRMAAAMLCIPALTSCASALPLAAPSAVTPPSPTQGTASSPAATATSTGPTEAADVPTLKGFSDVERAALRIRNIGCGSVSVGSGFAIDDHVIVTNRHVIEGAEVLQVQTYDGQDREVTTAGAATFADLAIVFIRETLPATLHLAARNPARGDPITVVGYPSGGELSTSSGHVLRYGADIVGVSNERMLINDAHIEHGSSGSPLVAADGEVVGVAYAGMTGGPYWAVPVEVLREILDDPGKVGETPGCN